MKKLLEIVDFTHKAWESVVWIATVILPFIGPPLGITSPTLARWIAVGAFVGGLSGYYLTVSGYAGKGREACMKRSAVYFRFVWLPFIFLVALLCILRPQVEAWYKVAATVRDFFIDFPLLPNLVGFLCGVTLVSLLIGGITLRSPKLWNSVLDGPTDSALRDQPQRDIAEDRKPLNGVDDQTIRETKPVNSQGKDLGGEPIQEEKNKENKRVVKKHLFLSYCHENREEVARLRGDLIAEGEAVWWDSDILVGKDWKQEIRRAMKQSYAVVLCLSEELAKRVQSGVYPEISDAIAAYRQTATGNIFLIPIRLSDCEIPDIEIDDTRTLERIQKVDLFPSAKRADGLNRLLDSLRAAPDHP